MPRNGPGSSPARRVSASTPGRRSPAISPRSDGEVAPGFSPAISAPAPRRHPAWYLAGAASALVAQNLSCGYFMLFFPPFVVLYALFELVSRQRLGDRRAWVALTATGAVAFAATLPFMAPYFELRESGIRSRGIPEIASFSADTYAYLTAQSNQRLWRWLAAFPRPEGHLFPGLVPIVLAVLGAAAAVVHAVRPAIGRRPMGEHRRTGRERLRHAAAVLTCTAGVVSLGLLAGMFYGFEGRYEIGPLSIRLFSVFRPFLYAVIAAGLTLALSRTARAVVWRLVRQPVTWAVSAALLAAWLSLGPLPTVLGDPLRDATIYPWLYAHVPGFDGLRVPARFAMVVMLALAWAAAAGYLALAGRVGPRFFPVVCSLALADAAAFPIPMAGRAGSDVYLAPPATIPVSAPPLARAIAELPPDAVLVELPFGDIPWEIRYTYLSMFHWRALVNGYSGHFPPRYLHLRAALAGLPETAQPRAWPLILSSGATHIVVHGEALGPERTARMRQWVEGQGARLVAQINDAYIYSGIRHQAAGRNPSAVRCS